MASLVCSKLSTQWNLPLEISFDTSADPVGIATGHCIRKLTGRLQGFRYAGTLKINRQSGSSNLVQQFSNLGRALIYLCCITATASQKQAQHVGNLRSLFTGSILSATPQYGGLPPLSPWLFLKAAQPLSIMFHKLVSTENIFFHLLFYSEETAIFLRCGSPRDRPIDLVRRAGLHIAHGFMARWERMLSPRPVRVGRISDLP